MFADLEKALDSLKDKDAGWVTRRDSADALGDAARFAIDALKSFLDESDVDVRLGVERALKLVGNSLDMKSVSAPRKTDQSLPSMIVDLEKPGSRTVERDGEGFRIEVILPRTDRKQIVYVKPYQRKDGVSLVRIYTFCGTPTDESYIWALRTNTRLAQGYLALVEGEGGDRLALMNCYIASELSAAELKASVKEVSYYGDWVESKLSNLDEL